jgi:hypothetical protein
MPVKDGMMGGHSPFSRQFTVKQAWMGREGARAAGV